MEKTVLFVYFSRTFLETFRGGHFVKLASRSTIKEVNDKIYILSPNEYKSRTDHRTM